MIKKKRHMHVTAKDKENLCEVVKNTIDHYCNLSSELGNTSALRDEVDALWDKANQEHKKRRRAEFEKAE